MLCFLNILCARDTNLNKSFLTFFALDISTYKGEGRFSNTRCNKPIFHRTAKH